MLSLTTAQLDALLLTWIYPLARVLGLIGTAPVFSSVAIPKRIRLALGLAITFAVALVVTPPANVQPGSWVGIGVFAQQVLIGIGMGLTMRIVMAAVDIAGDIIGLQMGLSFATFFDPDSSAQTAVLAEILSLISTLTFLALNGHLILIDVLVRSFEFLPIGQANITGNAWLGLTQVASVAFASGLLISLPIVAALLITNIALAVLTRTAPQLNIFAIGFPITSTVGFLILIISLDTLSPVLQQLYDKGFEHVGMLLKAFGTL